MLTLKSEGSYNAKMAAARDPASNLAEAAALLTKGSSSPTLASGTSNDNGNSHSQSSMTSVSDAATAIVAKEVMERQQQAMYSSFAAHQYQAAAQLSNMQAGAQYPGGLPPARMPFSAATCDSTVYPYPDTSTFIYDVSTRFYYDPLTGLLYDPTSTYFYDRGSSKYYYWEQARGLYIPVPPTGIAVTAQPNVQPTPSINNEINESSETGDPKKEKENKAKTAKKIAKEMEKWAKRMNSQKEAPLSVEKSANQNAASRTADIGGALFEASLRTDTGAPANGSGGLVAAAYDANDEEDNEDLALAIASGAVSATPSRVSMQEIMEQQRKNELAAKEEENAVANQRRIMEIADAETKVTEEETKLLDWTKLACLLCSRGFKDVATLQKHRNCSNLHLTNLNNLRAKYKLPPKSSATSSAEETPAPKNGSASTSNLSIDSLMQLGAITANHHAASAAARHKMAAEAQQALAQTVYRDRAQERRDRFGISDVSPPRGNKNKKKRGRREAEDDYEDMATAAKFNTVDVPTASIPLPLDVPAPPVDAASNVGGKMMERMGWQAGQGLGRGNQGRTDIIEAELREAGTGLGVKQVKRPPAGGKYQDNVKKAMYARFHEFD